MRDEGPMTRRTRSGLNPVKLLKFGGGSDECLNPVGVLSSIRKQNSQKRPFVAVHK